MLNISPTKMKITLHRFPQDSPEQPSAQMAGRLVWKTRCLTTKRTHCLLRDILSNRMGNTPSQVCKGAFHFHKSPAVRESRREGTKFHRKWREATSSTPSLLPPLWTKATSSTSQSHFSRRPAETLLPSLSAQHPGEIRTLGQNQAQWIKSSFLSNQHWRMMIILL